MADSNRRNRVGTLLRGLFQILMAEPDGLQARVALERLEERYPATEFEDSSYPGSLNARRYPKIMRFATLGPVKAGWMIKDRGQWSITEDGRKAYKQLTEPAAFVQEADRLYRQWRRAQPDLPTSESESELEDDNATVATALEEAEEAAWAEIQERLSSMSPYDLQDLVAGLLHGMGYHVFWVAPPGPDKGIDVVAFSDPLGVKGPRLKVQVKRQVEKVTAHGLRSFLALLNEGDAGLFVCTGGFTKDAENEARNQEKRRLMLVDSKKLFDLWVEHYQRVPEKPRSLLPIQPVYYLIPAARQLSRPLLLCTMGENPPVHNDVKMTRIVTTALLFGWNPTKNDWSEADEARLAQDRREGWAVTLTWNCRSLKGVAKGATAYLIKLGPGLRGIIGQGRLLGPPMLERNGPAGSHVVRIAMTTLLDPARNPILPMTLLKNDPILSGMHWSIQSSGIHIPGDVAKELKHRWAEFAHPKLPLRLPDEIAPNQKIFEGARRTVTVNVYERNPTARRQCLEHYGATCSVCGLDLNAAYGIRGRSIIHIHHLRPLHTVGRGYEVDPVRDLRPVCPNCHAAIHSHEPPYSPERVGAMMKRARARQP